MAPLQIFPINTHKLTLLFVPDWLRRNFLGGQHVYSFLIFCAPVCFQPPSREKQQHRKPSRERRHGYPCAWLRHALPYGGTERCCAAWQTTTPLQRRRARLLTGGGGEGRPAKQAHWHLPTHRFTHHTVAQPSHQTWQSSALVRLRKFGDSFPLQE